jgi:hypothetical protein
MSDTEPKSHLRQTFGWTTETRLHWVEIVGAGVGLAGPILAGAALGNLRAGLTAAVGGLMIGGVPAMSGWRAQGRAILSLLVPAVLAGFAAAVIGGRGWLTDAATIVLVGAAALIGGYSRALAIATVRLILFLVIAVAVAADAPDRAALLLLILAGAIWTSAADMTLGALARALQPIAPPAVAEPAAAEPVAAEPTRRQKFQRWRRSLRSLAGWQYALRLTVCLALAAALKETWPDRHLHWIGLTVALLTERPVDRFPVRTTQRALGTTLGVAITDLIGAHAIPVWLLVIATGVLAATRPLLRARNYLLYSAVMTPLVIIILDAGRPPDPEVLLERFVATLAGAAMVICANLLVARLLRRFG